MLSFDAIVVLIVLVFILISFYKEWVGPAFTFLIGVVVLGIFGILTPSEILGGFANDQVFVILMLLLIGDIIRDLGIVETLFDKVFQKATTYRQFMARMIFLVGAFSAFLNNTPLVAVMMPYVHNWSKRNNISPSKLLIPLSYAAILGGCITLIGTSTNLIVNGMVIDQKIIPALGSLDMFSFAYVGIPMMLIGSIYLLLVSKKWLPEKEDVLGEFSENSRKYIVEAHVKSNSGLIGKSIEEADLRNLKGLYLFQINRGDVRIAAVSHEYRLEEGDRLLFAGDTETIADLVLPNSGLTLPTVGMLTHKKHIEVVEIVISHNSTLISKTVKEANFRGHFDAAVIGIHRNGGRVSGKIGEVKLRAGDVLLLLGGDDFVDRSHLVQDFYFISKVKEFRKQEAYKIWLLLGGTVLAVVLSALKIVPLFMTLIVMIIVILALKISNPKDIASRVDFNLALIISLALAFGTAMIKSGLAEIIADLLISVFIPLGRVGVLFGIYLITSVLAAYITNKAAVAIVFPISLTIALSLHLNPEPFVLVVAFAAAANFMTPIGYQTNLMVYGPGGYTFKDFFKIGFPLTIIYMLVTVLILSYIYFY
ncbi:SLC13 family permease [Labilibaculum euxinus]|uniref:SLC13 family permease n=1 Tax=Labilibaculum euxinus TaxID=2686357 RepID=A0A7M4D2C0_9BACT|nr:SLC13 family permease [Labilibaculum euxinus]MUP36799.1 SLC13 family permease [Labilibaculum euxinus]MVB06004.1 SLC13 family permease [Labilibaculum euxinus]